MIRYLRSAGAGTLGLVFALMSMSAQAQSTPAQAQCSDYTSASDDSAYRAFIGGYAAASSQSDDDGRLTASVRVRCEQQPDQRFAAAVAAAVGPAPVMAASDPRAQPTSCQVGPTSACAGCSITCDPGTRAECRQGKDFAGGVRCATRPSCACR